MGIEREEIAKLRANNQKLRIAYSEGYLSSSRNYAVNRYEDGTQESDDWERGRIDGAKSFLLHYFPVAPGLAR